MLRGLGNVLYWLGIGLGMLFGAAGLLLALYGPGGIFIGGALIICGIIVYGIGRGCLYVLAGQK